LKAKAYSLLLEKISLPLTTLESWGSREVVGQGGFPAVQKQAFTWKNSPVYRANFVSRFFLAKDIELERKSVHTGYLEKFCKVMRGKGLT
jgi:hypothetical protein